MKTPTLEKVSEGSGTRRPLVFVKGYLSAEDDIANWLEALRESGWTGSVYQLRWDASTGGRLALRIGLRVLLGKAIVLTVLAGPMGRLAGATIGLTVRRHWKKHLRHAVEVGGTHLPRLLDELGEKQDITLAGFSLGCRVVVEALRAEAKAGRSRVSDVVLVGGAVPVSDEALWGEVATTPTGHVVNVHNTNDKVLAVLFRLAEWGKTACGLGPVQTTKDAVRNVDGTEAMKGQRRLLKTHLGWPEVFGQLGDEMPWNKLEQVR